MALVGTSWPWKRGVPTWVVDTVVIDNAIRDILLSMIGERKMNNNFGSQLIEVVFENKGPAFVTLATREITLALANQLPIIRVLSVDIRFPKEDDEPVDILITYEYLGEQYDTSVPVERSGT